MKNSEIADVRKGIFVALAVSITGAGSFYALQFVDGFEPKHVRMLVAGLISYGLLTTLSLRNLKQRFLRRSVENREVPPAVKRILLGCVVLSVMVLLLPVPALDKVPFAIVLSCLPAALLLYRYRLGLSRVMFLICLVTITTDSILIEF